MANQDFLSIRGIDFDYENKHSCNKLLRAVLEGDEKTVRKLLRSNWSPNTADNQGRTALHLAARSASLYNIMQLLLDNGGFPDHATHSGATPLCLSAYTGLDKTVALLLDSGASVNKKNNIEATPLHFACNGSSLEVVKLLVQAGALVNATDFYGTTPLMLAVKNKQHNIARYLLERGADVMVKDSDEKTVLHHACTNDDIEIFNSLQSRQCRTTAVGDITDSEGWTLLMFAAQVQASRITDRILEIGCDIAKKNNNGLLALHLAAHNSPVCFKSILDHTPIEVVNSYCIYSEEPITNSLPCLLIDKFHLDSLKYLFSKSGVDDGVLTCPIVKQKRVYPPVPFSFFSETSSNFASSVIHLYLQRGLPLDPDFPSSRCNSNIQIISCLESLITSHLFHMDPFHVEFRACKCAQLFVELLQNGASPDPYSFSRDLSTNNVLWFLCSNGFIFALSYLLRYSNFLEPQTILETFTSFIINTIHIVNSERSIKTVKFLCQLMRPWDIDHYRSFMVSKNLTSPNIDKIIEAYHYHDASFPSLKFLSRATLREYLHSKAVLHLESKCKQDIQGKCKHTGDSFRKFISNLLLPRSLLAYVLYDDIILSLQSHYGHPSFEI